MIRNNYFKLKDGRFKHKGGIYSHLYSEGCEKLEQVGQRRCECPISGSVQGHIGRGFEQAALVEGVRPHGRGIELDDL